MARVSLIVPYVASVAIALWVGIAGHQRDQNIEKNVHANCTVLDVLIDARADRDETVRLFASIRKENPPLFDKLVARAEAGDAKLAAARADQNC